MILLLLAMSISNPEYLKAKKALAIVESQSDVTAQNPKTTASGKYQFTKVWDDFFFKETGKTWTSVVPRKTAPLSERVNASIEQDQLFDVYFEKIVKKQIAKFRRRGIGKTYTDYELMAIIHRQGSYGAEVFLKTGKDKFTKYGTLRQHIAKFRRALD